MQNGLDVRLTLLGRPRIRQPHLRRKLEILPNVELSVHDIVLWDVANQTLERGHFRLIAVDFE